MDWPILGSDYLVELIYVELCRAHCKLCVVDLKKVSMVVGLGPGLNPHGINIAEEVLNNNNGALQGSEQKQIENPHLVYEI